MLSELEEIIAYKQFADQPERQHTIRKTWVKRFVRFICPPSSALK
jgi:FKBP12-rapamycin complex-associated protein